jgi:hypothetical protein
MALKMTSHLVVVRVRFDKPCTSAFAVAAVKACVHGEFYPPPIREWDGPDAFTVKGVTRLPKRCRREAA